MVMGRPKAEIPCKKGLSIRLTDFEFKRIARVAKEKNLTKTDAILKGIDLLEAINLNKWQISKNL